MERQEIKQIIKMYISELEQSIYEPIVVKDVGRIPIDATKAFFLLLPMLNGERWTERLNKAAIAVGAVHVAFDTHDVVDVANATSKQQQLTVLAGDHFSGVYYRLLASIPELGFIQSLSRTIGHINEVKTTLHQQLPDNPVQLVEAIRTIEAGCITDFLHTFGFSQYATLANVALPLLRLENGLLGGKTANLDQAITQLHDEFRDALRMADFLTPFLRQEIHHVVLPHLGKMI